MFELPEYAVLARQMNEALQGKTIQRGQLGNSSHKFVWYNRTHEEFEELTRGKTIGEARSKGRWLSVPLEPGYVLLFGECGGKVLFHEPGSKLPVKYDLYINFKGGSFLTAMTQMWGAMELYEEGQELESQYVKDMRPTPVQQVTEEGGRYDATDLYGQKGGYVRLMDKNAVKRPCPECGGSVEKINYLGGACYLCPTCQQ